MCCHTRTLKLYIDCAPQPPSRAEFSVLRLISKSYLGLGHSPLLSFPDYPNQQRHHLLTSNVATV